MSRLDRLVRAAGPHMDDDESLLGSVLGRAAQGRGHLALVATNRRLLVVRDRFTHDEVEQIAYGDVTQFDRQDAPGVITVEVVTTTGRHRLERIADTPEARVVLRLISRRIEGDAAETVRRAAAAAAAGPIGANARVRIVT